MAKNPASEGRYRRRLNDDCLVINNIIDELNERMFQFNGVPDPNINNIITFNLQDSFIQPHQDDYGCTQLRINIIIEKEELSGNPIIGGLLYKIQEKDCWVFSPSSVVHGTTKLKTGNRINLSLGWNFKNDEDYLNAFISFNT